MMRAWWAGMGCFIWWAVQRWPCPADLVSWHHIRIPNPPPLPRGGVVDLIDMEIAAVEVEAEPRRPVASSKPTPRRRRRRPSPTGGLLASSPSIRCLGSCHRPRTTRRSRRRRRRACTWKNPTHPPPARMALSRTPSGRHPLPIYCFFFFLISPLHPPPPPLLL
jgi:hypothetical protein